MKFKELKNMNKKDRESKLKDLKLELVKAQTGSGKTPGKSRNIKRLIAKILTLNTNDNKEVLNKK